MRHSEQLGELDLLDHLPRDALQRRQAQQQLPEAPAAVVLAVADVVLQIDLDLVAELLDFLRLREAFRVWNEWIFSINILLYQSGQVSTPKLEVACALAGSSPWDLEASVLAWCCTASVAQG